MAEEITKGSFEVMLNDANTKGVKLSVEEWGQLEQLKLLQRIDRKLSVIQFSAAGILVLLFLLAVLFFGLIRI